MCGIAGLLTKSTAVSPQDLDSIAAAMDTCLAHRGPDDRGTWIDRNLGVALVHRRLSIVDLSPTGHQPMVSANGRYVISFNGEIYSFQEIRKELEEKGVQFRGSSDTEVILEAVVAFGLEATLKRMIGMFAIALWDRQERKLFLIRDRLGIKPIYWAKFGSLFLFGSELKALRASPGWAPRIDQSAVAAFMRHGYVPAPHTIYQGVHKLEPGSILTLSWNGEPTIARFWDARTAARDGLAAPLQGGEHELTDHLASLLQDAVKRRMVADVPVGAFLSGGVDSATVVALMKAANTGPVKTFSIGFDIAGFNEAPHAAAVASHLQTDHTELRVTAQQAINIIPSLPEWYDEPFADSSQIPTYLISALARNHVTVALSGDGGDELFGGYNRYNLTQRYWRWLSMLPQPMRGSMARVLTGLSPDRWTAFSSMLPSRMTMPRLGDKMHKAAAALKAEGGGALYQQLITHWDPNEATPGTPEPDGILADTTIAKDFTDLTRRMQFLDQVTYLPDDILTKVDRASMAVGLEARVPLIDHRVVELSWRLPRNVLIRGSASKWILRQVLYRHVPRELIERPKMGFAIPLGEWLRGPLRDWAECLLAEGRLHTSGLLNAGLVRRYWAEHISGRRNREQQLWDVLMLEAWRERWN